MKILVVSPHRDDAAFSLSLSIQQWLASGHQVILVNCFTRTAYAPYSDAESKPEDQRVAYVSALRKKEDELFLTRISGASMVDLNIKDAPLRLDIGSNDVCAIPMPEHDDAVARIQKHLMQVIEEHLSSSVQKPEHGLGIIMPLALGGHVDHRTARDAAIPLLKTPGVALAFYEDLPYAERPEADRDLLSFRHDLHLYLGEDLKPVLCHAEDAVGRKQTIALGYVSQIDADLAQHIASFAEHYDGGERYWATSAWIASAARAHLGQLERGRPQPLAMDAAAIAAKHTTKTRKSSALAGKNHA